MQKSILMALNLFLKFSFIFLIIVPSAFGAYSFMHEDFESLDNMGCLRRCTNPVLSGLHVTEGTSSVRFGLDGHASSICDFEFSIPGIDCLGFDNATLQLYSTTSQSVRFYLCGSYEAKTIAAGDNAMFFDNPVGFFSDFRENNKSWSSFKIVQWPPTAAATYYLDNFSLYYDGGQCSYCRSDGDCVSGNCYENNCENEDLLRLDVPTNFFTDLSDGWYVANCKGESTGFQSFCEQKVCIVDTNWTIPSGYEAHNFSVQFSAVTEGPSSEYISFNVSCINATNNGQRLLREDLSVTAAESPVTWTVNVNSSWCNITHLALKYIGADIDSLDARLSFHEDKIHYVETCIAPNPDNKNALVFVGDPLLENRLKLKEYTVINSTHSGCLTNTTYLQLFDLLVVNDALGVGADDKIPRASNVSLVYLEDFDFGDSPWYLSNGNPEIDEQGAFTTLETCDGSHPIASGIDANPVIYSAGRDTIGFLIQDEIPGGTNIYSKSGFCDPAGEYPERDYSAFLYAFNIGEADAPGTNYNARTVLIAFNEIPYWTTQADLIFNNTLGWLFIPDDSCTPPASGSWNITDGDWCTLSTSETITGNLSIWNGSLKIDGSGTLTVQDKFAFVYDNCLPDRNCNLTILSGGQLNG